MLLKWLKQCSSALKYLHNDKIVHRDIKPANIFLTTNNDVKIGDFGQTLFIDRSYNRDLTRSIDSGSIFYHSPETVQDSKYSHKTDIWLV